MASLKLFFTSVLFIIICAQLRLANARRNETKLLDLNFDVLCTICEQSESLADLITWTEASDHFIPVARHVFKRNYTGRTSLRVIGNGYLVIGYDTHDRDSIHTNDYDFITHFGDLFTKILIEFSHMSNTTDQIKFISAWSEHINKYCADTLIELEVYSDPMFDFDAMKKPFGKLEILSLQGDFKASSASAFSALFPSLRELSLNSIKSLDVNFIVNHYPHLERVSLKTLYFKDSEPFKFEEFLKKNPQIRSFMLKRFYVGIQNILKAVNRYLPDLEELKLYEYHPFIKPEDRDIILFENVKYFTIGQDYPPQNIQFGNLVEFCTTGYFLYNEKWVDFVERYPNLQRLYVNVSLADDTQVEKLTTIASNLTEVYLDFHNYVSNENILNLVRNNPKLEKMYLDARYLSLYSPSDYSLESIAVLLREEFGDKFEIVTESEKQLLMTRLD